MTEATAVPKDQATTTIALAAATMGHDLVAALLLELRTMPAHWPTMNAEMQQKIIERLKDKVSGAVTKAQHMLTASEFQAVPAKLEFVNRKGGIRAGVTVNHDALCRHALFDAQGKQVLIVIVDPERWLNRMDELKAVGNQQDLFDRTDSEYDASKDQPGYRRDQDPFAPAVPWSEMKAKLGLGSEPLPDADEKVNAVRVQQRIFQEQLSELGFVLSLGAIQERTPEEFDTALLWMAAYAADPTTCYLERPSWIPEPTPKPDSKS